MYKLASFKNERGIILKFALTKEGSWWVTLKIFPKPLGLRSIRDKLNR